MVRRPRGAWPADDPDRPRDGDLRSRHPHGLLGHRRVGGAADRDRRSARRRVRLGPRAPRRGAGARRDRGALRVRGAGDHERRADVPRLRPPRRHGDMVQPHRCPVLARAIVLQPAHIDLPVECAAEPGHGDAARCHRCRLPVRLVHAPRRRPLGNGRRRYRVAVPALPRLLRRGGGARGLQLARIAARLALATRVRRFRRGAVGSALRLRDLGRDKGAHRRLPGRARRRAHRASRFHAGAALAQHAAPGHRRWRVDADARRPRRRGLRSADCRPGLRRAAVERTRKAAGGRRRSRPWRSSSPSLR